MMTLLKKEIDVFLNSLVGYLSIAIFLIAVGSILWVFPETNVLDFGFASLEPLFSFGPYLFMFLVPALTMRSFAEEKRNGTLELLYTLPFSLWQIILSKYLAGFILVIFSLIPTLIYFFSIYFLGNPIGNLDISGIMGSYLGLALLGGIFIALGIFASALTENQIVSFLLSVFLCFLSYQGFELLASLDQWGKTSYFIEQIGISFHYNAMSRGLIDLRDLTYFFGVIFLILFSTRLTAVSKR